MIIRSTSPLFTALLLLNLTAALSAQTNRSTPPLQLSAEIVSQSYCAVTPDSAALEMKLKLRYRNIGSQKIILYKGHDLFYQTRIRNAPGNVTGAYEVSTPIPFVAQRPRLLVACKSKN